MIFIIFNDFYGILSESFFSNKTKYHALQVWGYGSGDLL